MVSQGQENKVKKKGPEIQEQGKKKQKTDPYCPSLPHVETTEEVLGPPGELLSTLSQYPLLGFEISQLEFHHLH